MKLAISNIGWDPPEERSALAMLRDSGVGGIEIAPTKVWPGWQGATLNAARSLRQRLATAGYEIPALQSVLFERPDLQLFGDQTVRRALREHLVMIGHLACAMEAPVIVFGSPRNRDRGALSSADATEQAAAFLADVGSDLATLGVVLCIEANPAAYGCNFLTHVSESAELVARIDSPGIGLHFDVACTMLSGDDPIVEVARHGRLLRHFHISEPQLGCFSLPTIDHPAVGEALRLSGYDGWVSVEMRRQMEALQQIGRAIAYAKHCYL